MFCCGTCRFPPLPSTLRTYYIARAIPPVAHSPGPRCHHTALPPTSRLRTLALPRTHRRSPALRCLYHHCAAHASYTGPPLPDYCGFTHTVPFWFPDTFLRHCPLPHYCLYLTRTCPPPHHTAGGPTISTCRTTWEDGLFATTGGLLPILPATTHHRSPRFQRLPAPPAGTFPRSPYYHHTLRTAHLAFVVKITLPCVTPTVSLPAWVHRTQFGRATQLPTHS